MNAAVPTSGTIRKWKKWLLWSGATVAALVIAGALAFWWLMNRPLYNPGDARASSALDPPAQTGDRWAVARDVSLHHFASGGGTRNALFVHGGPGLPQREPAPGLKAIEGTFRVHYYDQRGCGRSTRPFDRFTGANTWDNIQRLEGTLGIGAQLADIERIRRILADEKIVLIGHSFGGFLAALYAAEFPERVSALVLIAPASTLVLPSEGGDLFRTVRDRLPETERPGFDAWHKSYLDFGHLFKKSEAKLQAEHMRFADYYAKAAGRRVAMSNAGDVGGWMPTALYLSMGRRHDYRSALGGITAPALIVHGDRDLQPDNAAREYAQLIPKATFKTIPGAGHFPQIEQPEALGVLVATFLSDR